MALPELVLVEARPHRFLLDQQDELGVVLDELDDVQNVYDNSELSAEEVARLAG